MLLLAFLLADVAMSLCRMVAYNIGQLAYMHAKRYDLKRVFFGGFFIRGHPYTMETISFAIKFWSQVHFRLNFPVCSYFLHDAAGAGWSWAAAVPLL